MHKHIRWILFLIVSLVGLSATTVLARQTYTEQDAIQLVVDSPVFHDVLAGYPGWTAAAYDTQDAYGIWHVQLWAANGDDLGWADVSPARSRVYAWESHVGASDAQKAAAMPILRDFLSSLPEITELMDNPAQYPMYVDYNGWEHGWGIHIDRGADSIDVLVQFDGKTPTSFDNPHLVGISFPGIMSYDDWQSSKKALAVAAAYQNTQIADALSNVDSWTTSTEKQDGDIWVVSFMNGDTTVAQVTVNLATNQVIEAHVEG